MEDAGIDTSKRIVIPADLIRTVAIGLVLLLHASNETVEASSLPTAYWWTGVVYKSLALSCVPLFVMLSGALLLQPAKLNEPIRVFLKKRVNRIGLAFAFWSAVYLAWGFYTTQVPVTLDNVTQGIVRGIFTGPYYHFWFIYLIIGLYLITPILRVVIAYAKQPILRYLILLWFIGVAVLPIIELAVGLTLNTAVFLIGGFVGYFVLGIYLQKINVRSSILYILLILAFVSTVFGIWLMNYPLNALGQNYFFFGYLTVNVVVGSVALFLILSKFNPDWPGSNHTRLKRVIKLISRNTLPIFLLHVIILESFERGFFGVKLSYTTLNPIIEIPLIAVLTLFITLGLILLMRKVPVLKKLIG